MKKTLCLIAALTMLLTIPAFAQTNAAVSLGGTAHMVGDTIYYSGSLDGKQMGVYRMNLDGSDPTTIYGSEALILSVSNGSVLLEDWSASQLVLLDASGAEKTRLDGYYYSAVCTEEGFYLGDAFLPIDGGALQTLFEPKNGEHYYYEPAFVRDGWYYYFDRTEFADLAVAEGNMSVAALMRRNIATGETETVSGAGTKILGRDENYIVYTRITFECYNDEEYYDAGVDEGLFRYAFADGKETRLSDVGGGEDNHYLQYSLYEDGVVYGRYVEYDDEYNYTIRLRRVGADGAAFEDIDMPDASLFAARDGKLYLSEYNAEESENSYLQKDRIVVFDLADGSVTNMLEDKNLMLFFTESDPFVTLYGDHFYFIAYDTARSATSLYRCAVDGSDLVTLAMGYSYEEESVG